MRKHEYNNHEEYVSKQVGWNKKKINLVWVGADTITAVARHIQENLPNASFGLCHGTRRGVEQAELGKILGIDVLGTEISDTAENFPNTIQWDFHNVKDEWVGDVDFIYSNSLDHSYNPELAMGRWMSCLKTGGLCFIDWSDEHGDSHVNDLDCFGATIEEMRDFLSKFGGLSEIRINDNRSNHFVFIVEK